jgi:hypothetical protein
VIEQALDVIMRGSSGIHVVTRYLRIPTLTRSRYLRAVRQLDAVVFELIARGREKITEDSGDSVKDLLTLLLLARDEDGSMNGGFLSFRGFFRSYRQERNIKTVPDDETFAHFQTNNGQNIPTLLQEALGASIVNGYSSEEPVSRTIDAGARIAPFAL